MTVELTKDQVHMLIYQLRTRRGMIQRDDAAIDELLELFRQALLRCKS